MERFNTFRATLVGLVVYLVADTDARLVTIQVFFKASSTPESKSVLLLNLIEQVEASRNIRNRGFHFTFLIVVQSNAEIPAVKELKDSFCLA